MFAISVVIFVTGLVAFVGLLILGRPMIQASERQFALAASRSTLKTLRGERGELNVQMADLDNQKRELDKALGAMTAEQKELNDKIGRLPKRVYELTFELGAPEGGAQPYEFIVSRQAAYLDLEKVFGPERQLWERPRVLRVWSRSHAAAVSAAEKRYPVQNGFVVRSAERIAVSADPPRRG
jgi:chromosome segregation ATPase